MEKKEKTHSSHGVCEFSIGPLQLLIIGNRFVIVTPVIGHWAQALDEEKRITKSLKGLFSPLSSPLNNHSCSFFFPLTCCPFSSVCLIPPDNPEVQEFLNNSGAFKAKIESIHRGTETAT